MMASSAHAEGTGIGTTAYGSALAEHGLRLLPAHEGEPAEVLQFELRNRAHFARSIPDRGDDYYALDAVAASLQDACRWWAAGSDLLYVVTERAGKVVARVNLVDLADGRAALGYRVGEDHEGMGIATAAVTDLLHVARTRNLHQVTAVTSTANVASERVLQKCGFVCVGMRRAALLLGDTMLDAKDWLVET